MPPPRSASPEILSPSGLTSLSPTPTPQPEYQALKLDNATLEAERLGILPTTDKDALKERYKRLYQARDDVQKQMDIIKSQLSPEELRVLVVEIEGLKLATLPMPGP